MAEFKLRALTALGLLGGCIAELLGGWDAGLQSLFLFMAIDYITGLIVAGVFKKSRKYPARGVRKSGGLERPGPQGGNPGGGADCLPLAPGRREWRRCFLLLESGTPTVTT